MNSTTRNVLCFLCLMWLSESTKRIAVAAFSTIHKRSFVPDSVRKVKNKRSASSSNPFVFDRTRSTSEHAVSIDDEEQLALGYKRPTVNWYPGHIAKAERQLSETLKAVDVVLEVRDARCCKATSHYKVAEWCAGKPRIVVLTHSDVIPKLSVASWKRSYDIFGAGKWDGQVTAQILNQVIQNQLERNKYTSEKNSKPAKPTTAGTTKSIIKGPPSFQSKQAVSQLIDDVLFINAKNGQGIHSLHRAILKAGAHVQERRKNRGLADRALRVGIIGYPNVGKSALINRILGGRKRAKTQNIPGVTRSLQWIRVRSDDTTSNKKDFELLDTPGVIPAKLIDQSDAILLAACNCIGDAAYDNQAVAAYLFEWIQALHVVMGKGEIAAPQFGAKCKERYGFDPLVPVVATHYDNNDMFNNNNENKESKESMNYMTGEDILYKIADELCRGNSEDAARKMLQDFRCGRLGPICLQLAPESEEDEGQRMVSHLASKGSTDVVMQQRLQSRKDDEERLRARAEAAMETALKQGLELPPLMEKQSRIKADQDDNEDADTTGVGKGLFEGW